jgi:hypothetical protein
MPKSDSIIISSTIGTESRKIARPMPSSVKFCSDPRTASRNVAQNPEDLLGLVAFAAPTASIGSCILPPIHKLIGGQSPPQFYFPFRFKAVICHWKRLAQAMTNDECNMRYEK